MNTLATDSLSTFLSQPDIETSPAWEFIDGKSVQKPVPTLFHSRLQRNLVNYINRNTEQLEAIQKLRCIIPPYSPVPDIAVIARKRLIEEDEAFQGSPDWLIEILSRGQSPITLQNKILHCLSNGTQLAWLIDLKQKQIWVWEGENLPNIYSHQDSLPTLENVPSLSVDNIIAMTGIVIPNKNHQVKSSESILL
ncbi:MAG: Uma2 family endonuclease, partial [Halothece sp.]